MDSNATDMEIVSSVKLGNMNDFELLVSRYEKKIFNIVLRMCKNYTDAEDLTQEVFLKVYSGLQKFREESGFYTYIYRIAVNTTIDFCRKKNTAAPEESIYKDGEGGEYTLELPDSTYSPEAVLEKKELTSTLFDAINTLPDNHRQMILMRDVDGLSYAEIASCLELNEGTVKSRINRAREALKKDLLGKGNFFEKYQTKEVNGKTFA